jgi:elongation factor 1-beta
LLNVNSYSPSQADVTVLKAITYDINPAKFPCSFRWFRHIKSFKDEFPNLPGDPSKPLTTYGPEAPVTKAAGDADDEDIDLFGSDDEEEDAEAIRIREERLAGEYLYPL